MLCVIYVSVLMKKVAINACIFIGKVGEGAETIIEGSRKEIHENIKGWD